MTNLRSLSYSFDVVIYIIRESMLHTFSDAIPNYYGALYFCLFIRQYGGQNNAAHGYDIKNNTVATVVL